MKKFVFIIYVLMLGCQDKKEEEASPLVGTWKLIEMGTYTVSGKCSGEVDDEEYRGLKSKGFTLTLELKKDGTGIQTVTGPDAGTENFTWSDFGQTICIKNDCVSYEMAPNELSFRLNKKVDAYCQDEDYNITIHDSKRACEEASTSNAWYPEQCDTERYRKNL